MTIGDVATIVRSKVAGPFLLSLEAMWSDEALFIAVREARAITPETVARAYDIATSDVRSITWYDDVMAVKCVIWPKVRADAYRCRDVYGAQRHLPFANLEIGGKS